MSTIVFVYNADSGFFNTLTDTAHKIFAPESYECNLCAITYGNFAMKGEWQAFLATLDAEFEFLHRDQLAQRYGITGIQLPAIFCKEGETLIPWISAEQINACHDITDLKELLAKGSL
jgi:hypothetical protein